MTFRDWVRESAHRYRTQPFGKATRESAYKFRMGVFRRLGPRLGKPIWARGDWDVLVVMDACRYDLWQEVAPEYDQIPDPNNSVYSNASCSIDWINYNFNDYPDQASRAGYVTANPFADHSTETCRSADLSTGAVAYFNPLYRSHWQDLFDDQIATVTPEDVTDHAIQAWRERDQLGIDQLVIHYMQPHEPYRARPEWGSGDHKLLGNLIDPDQPAGSSIWPAMKDGAVGEDEFWAVYQDNLRWVLDDVTERLLPNLDGTVVLSSDHGNALGEWGEWHHPPGALSPAARRVPWVPVECTDRETVDPGVETESEQLAADGVEAQLEALGYR